MSLCVRRHVAILMNDEWLIMKLCMYVGNYDANNVSNFGGDPVTQFNLKKLFKNYLSFCIPKYAQCWIS